MPLDAGAFAASISARHVLLNVSALFPLYSPSLFDPGRAAKLTSTRHD
jgi:hypothetical protein